MVAKGIDINKFLMESADDGLSLQLVNDDEGHWAVSDVGTQPVGEKPQDVCVMLEESWWEDSPAKAIANYIERRDNPEPLSPELEEEFRDILGIKDEDDEW